jgi:prepilin-type N-terminal cleavage/methylation domain-containing protein
MDYGPRANVMKTPQTRPGTRRGFTLIELLIVIAIIGVILSLIAAAVVQAQRTGRRTQNRVDIGQIEVALDQFKQRFGAYPPSRIKLCESLLWYDLTTNAQGQPINQLDTDSVQFINKMFPNIDQTIWASGIDWNGNGKLDAAPPQPGMDAPGAITLEGDQCLTFFLGGIPSSGVPLACLGFSADPRNPTNTTADRIGPFFEFPSNRLVVNQFRVSQNPANIYFSYVDAYSSTDGAGTLLSGAPYAYFSSYKTANNYNRYQFFNQPGYPILLSFTSSDCSSLQCIPPGGLNGPPAILPYIETVTTLGKKYWKPNSFQIISAGQDGVFGVANATVPWNSVTGASYYQNVTGSGYDDQANFTGGMIGAGPN